MDQPDKPKAYLFDDRAAALGKRLVLTLE